MKTDRRHRAYVWASGVLIALGVSGCGGALRLHDESKAKLATGIKDKYAQANVLGAVEVEKQNLDNLQAEELKVVRDNQRLRTDYALLSMADGSEPMGVIHASALRRLNGLGFVTFKDARQAQLEEITLGATDQKLQRDSRLIKSIAGSSPPPCRPEGSLPATLPLPNVLTDTEQEAVTGLYERYREGCEKVKAAFQAKVAGAMKEAEDEWKAARDEATRLEQSVEDGKAAVKERSAAYDTAAKAVKAAANQGAEVKSKAEAAAKSALEALDKAKGVLKLVETRNDATKRIDALVVLLTATAEGTITTSDPKLTTAATVTKEIPSLAADMAALLTRAGTPSVNNLLIEMRHQVLLIEYVKNLKGFARQRADILKARYDALREEARLWRTFHDAMCSYAERSAGRPHPGQACDGFVVQVAACQTSCETPPSAIV